MVLRQAVWIIGAGLGAGLIGASLLSRFLRSMLFEITGHLLPEGEGLAHTEMYRDFKISRWCSACPAMT